ncbi:MAG TPA: hypothetical protein VF798_06230, partial [Burkholderiaceae bacterium]
LADWAGVENEIALLRQAMASEPAAEDNRASPFSFLALPGTTAAEQQRCAEKWAYAMYRPLCLARAERGFADRLSPGKPHIAYLSADFHDHATARLMIEVFERHDRERFRFTAYAYGPRDDSAMTARLERAFDRMVDIRGDSVFEAAAKIRADGVDILVDLKGYTGASRSDILALCPAPIQVNYLGYPGTMGADFVDYLIADRFVIPEAQRAHYSERIAYLPDTYQPTDGRRARPPAPPRATQGLPENGFVFCCFNQVYKITPVIMDVWCALLRDVPGSVLWLIGSDAPTEENLRLEAERRGVARERIVFAPRTDPVSHLARHGCADLFLDTLPYNAHTTCSDALWMGLPVLTCAGDTFPSRVAGSLLHALGLPELVTHDLAQYAALAQELARDVARLAAVREKIIVARDHAPLFDATRFTRNLEQVYRGMLDAFPSRRREVRIAIVAPEGYAHSHAFDEFGETLLHGFRALGYKADLARNAYLRHGFNVVLGANLLTVESAALLPRHTVIYNLEQIYPGSPWLKGPLAELFARFEVWDYSRRNVTAIAALVPQARVRFAPVGHMPQLCRIAPEPQGEDIDVLFYGSLNDRRRRVLDGLRRRGVNVEAVFGVYGAERDALIARAKLVLNLRLYDSDIFEIVRVSYLLGNGKAVVSE